MDWFTNERLVEDIVRQHSGMIIRIAFQYVRNRTDAEDIMQDVFFSLLKQPPFETNEHIKAWLIRVTINKCKNLLKSKKQRNSVSIVRDFAATEEDFSVFEDLQRLSESDRNIIYLFYYEGYPAKEIGKFLEIKEHTVEMRLSRARKKLKSLLED